MGFGTSPLGTHSAIIALIGSKEKPNLHHYSERKDVLDLKEVLCWAQSSWSLRHLWVSERSLALLFPGQQRRVGHGSNLDLPDIGKDVELWWTFGLWESCSENCSCFKPKYPRVQAISKSYQDYCGISNKEKGDKLEAWKII